MPSQYPISSSYSAMMGTDYTSPTNSLRPGSDIININANNQMAMGDPNNARMKNYNQMMGDWANIQKQYFKATDPIGYATAFGSPGVSTLGRNESPMGYLASRQTNYQNYHDNAAWNRYFNGAAGPSQAQTMRDWNHQNAMNRGMAGWIEAPFFNNYPNQTTFRLQ